MLPLCFHAKTSVMTLSKLNFGMFWDAGFWILTSIVELMVALHQSLDLLSVLPQVVTFLVACRTMLPFMLKHSTEIYEQKPSVNGGLWRQPVKQTVSFSSSLANYAPWQGLTMSRVLIPFLLRSMSAIDHQYRSINIYEKHIERNTCPWDIYGKTATILLICFFWGNNKYSLQKSSYLSAAIIMVPIATNLSGIQILPWSTRTDLMRMSVFVGTWLLSFHAIDSIPPFHMVFTIGEWTVVTCGVAIAVSEMALEMLSLSSLPPYQRVALVGCSGCGIAITVLYCVKPWAKRTIRIKHDKFILLMLELVVLISLPLLMVEWTLRKTQAVESSNLPFPCCLTWLWQFLATKETGSQPMTIIQFQFSLPRYIWLVYWATILAVAALLLPALYPLTEEKAKLKTYETNKSLSTTVVLRKFFHGLAVLLFTPVAIFAPQLLSLSYAIATALLMVMEYVRADLPMVQSFYNQYLDPTKDNGAKVVVSHAALILGCAIPHWIASACCRWGTSGVVGTQVAFPLLLLRLWGVISLGIGDALGAIVGTWYGLTLWGGPTRRTVEGSIAMCIGMMLACSCLVGADFVAIWMPAVVLTTWLEAVTLQIDNMVLPLTGSAWILFLASFRNFML